MGLFQLVATLQVLILFCAIVASFSSTISETLLFFSTITQSTVGFGDISPKTPKAKILVVAQILTSFILLSL